MKNLFGLSFACLLLLAGCYAAVLPLTEVPQRRQNSSFQVGVEQKASIGEPMVVEENLYFYKGIVVTSDLNTQYFSLVEGQMLKIFGKTETGYTYYEPIGVKPEQAAIDPFVGSKTKWTNCLAVDSKGEAVGYAPCTYGQVYKFPQPFTGFKESPVYTKGTMRLELIYNGKAKDTLRLTFREYNDNLAQAAFTQDLTYDLSESKTIGFRKLKIEVIEATNSEIKFVIQHGNMMK